MIEKLSFLNQPNCHRIANDLVDLIVSTDVGPRILRYGFIGQENILGENPHFSLTTPWGDWKPWAGHRLWVAPEEKPKSYAPDNSPVHAEITGHYRICLTQPVDRAGFEKQITVELAVEGTGVVVHHQITNRNQSGARIAPWAITLVRGAGVALIPLEQFRSHAECVAPASSIVLWYYTDLTDPRFILGPRLLRLRSNASQRNPQKIGAINRRGWCAFHHSATRTLFLKSVSYDPGAIYPDFGANTEVYTAGDFAEIETLGPLVDLAPNESVNHVERWRLGHEVELARSDDEIERAVAAAWTV